MNVDIKQPITIAGAGLAGSLLALLLARQGYQVDLFERNADPRGHSTDQGRSINLALAERGRHALSLAGILDQVDQTTIAMRGRMLHDRDGSTVLQPYGARNDEVIWSTHRGDLNRTLLDAAEASQRVTLHFEHKLTGIDWQARTMDFADRPTRSFNVLIGTDGGGSAVRREMLRVTDLGVSEELLEHGYRELEIPPTPGGEFALDPHALHIWPRGGFMMIALPNDDRSFTGTLFLANQGEPSFEALGSWTQQKAFCLQQFADAVPLMPDLQSEFRDNPVGLLGTIRCQRWYLDNRAVLLGDAAHAVVPFHGQGMNAAFEDCVAFAELLKEPGGDWQDIFSQFEQARRANSNAIADMALENYIIMRSSVREPGFLMRKALEHELERRFGDRFVGRYSLVMFHRVPYQEAKRRGVIQAEILDQLTSGAEHLEQVDFEVAERLIEAQLSAL